MDHGAAIFPIRFLLQPRSVAFVGISAKGGPGARMLAALNRSGFTGPVWPVNEKYPELGGRRCYPSLSALPETPDCVIVAVPAAAVADVLRDAAAVSVRAAMVISEGFADANTDVGRARQEEIVAIARQANMAVAGPNSMGIAALSSHFAATMAEIPATVQSGGISLVSQSGGLLNAVVELSANRGVGLHYLISIGNQAVVDLADYIDFLVEDPQTKVIALIMEGAKNGRRFRDAIQRAARAKPVVVLKLGSSTGGQAATLAHTGTLAGQHAAYVALFQQSGIALVESIDELVESAALFAAAPLPRGNRVAMLTVSGGATSLIADLGEKAGIAFAPIRIDTDRRLQNILSVERSFSNPIDTVGLPRLRRDNNMKAVLDALIDDDMIDVIGLVLGMRIEGFESHNALIEVMADRAKSSEKPLMVLSFISNSLTRKWRGYASAHGLPLLEDLEGGLKAIAHLVHHAEVRRRPAVSLQTPRSLDVSNLDLSNLDLPDLAPNVTLTEAESKKILAAAGLPVTREVLARTPAEAGLLASDFDGAVVLKIQSPDIPHKSDVGGVFLGARGQAEVKKAAEDIVANARRACPVARIDGVLVQEMVGDGVEFILGMTYDDQLGPMIVLGAGGTAVEVFKDAAVRLPPLLAGDVRDMISELKCARLLDGYRGAPPRDVEALVDCCVRFADFVAATDGRYAAIDLNPVLVLGKGQGVKIADALIVTRDHHRERSNATN
jgi:acetyltransferase